ncbi:MAG: hypothetical protein JNM69_37975 [Archangium sp.]|nr:hypothetical protein [Archangium sp.]
MTWLLLLTTAFLFSPPAAPDTNDVIRRMLVGQLEGINVSLFALFNVMGVLPMSFLAVLAFDAKAQRVPKWPFVMASFALGAYALLPYLVLRQWELPRRPAETWWLRLLSSRLLGVVLTALGLTLVALFVTGDVRGFVTLVRTQQFPFAMTLDFAACWVLGALLAREEARVRHQPVLRWVGLVPVLGVPLVLALRSVHRAA